MSIKIIKDINYRNDAKYRFVLNEPSEIYINLGKKRHQYLSKKKVWASYENERLRIEKDYAWNGASPARKVFGVWVGPPCPHSVIFASLYHDLGWQFAPLLECLWDFNQSNDMFYSIMHQLKFPLTSVYHGAVKNIGPVYRKFCKIEDISLHDLDTGVFCTKLRI
jgi:hypothetical protein